MKYIFDPIYEKNENEGFSGTVISPTWGIRRVYNDLWLLEFATGISCFIDTDSEVSWGPKLNLRFGVVF